MSATNALAIPGKAMTVGLTLPAGLSYESWLAVIAKLKLVTRASMWWWGDALNYGERKWGEKYEAALDESDYDYQTLRNAKWVAARFELSARADKLSFKHHEVVASLDPKVRGRLLREAEKDGLSVQQLRLAVHRVKSTFKEQAFGWRGYRVLYCDPPWRYCDNLTEGYGAAEHHYKTLSIEELCEFKDKNGVAVRDLPAPDAVLFLWVTSPLLKNCHRVVEAWGFDYAASFIWDKVKHNWGHYNSVRHELLLVCTRGSCTPDNPKLYPSVQRIERTEKHSEKPEQFRAIIDDLYPHKVGSRNDRIELFARGGPQAHWDSYGNEVLVLNEAGAR